MGDAEIHAPQFIAAATTTAQQETDRTRIQNSLNFLKNCNVNHILLRRRAVEEIRVVLTSRPNAYEPFKGDIVDVFNKILKKPKEDIVVLEQILWTITNLSHANSKLVHELLPTVSCFSFLFGWGFWVASLQAYHLGKNDFMGNDYSGC
uniref:Uncharacterized protein n=1 Tax=Panagrolaimus sp. PS1159 TaxID=55785 RepID=A0AC35GI81_9BILA